ncbi:endonuclease/exonuclease/phosphatase family protein [Azospirillum canadense]|uniref:endonuclease/exonuclease/phosphatase family protein n=1 Tax=Azospirillum canadense TaxID=403962 RepID=UPI0022263358|nr:endonuclease/exonuclease/phosphatase family protein [Azospirillum canadense]MCW2239951.1 endonuclease/exonuclease/phosphatase family metal-dependent hydrolase [Azospirillum canadense]
MALRVASWNVYHGAINGVQPQTRMTNFAAYCWGLAPRVDIISFQEVPIAMMGNLPNVVNGTGYNYLRAAGEYPAYPPGLAPATNKLGDGYAVLYNPTRVAPVGIAARGDMPFINAANFKITEGQSQGRPPVGCVFQRTGDPTVQFNFADWHNETGAWADPAIVGLHNTYVPLAADSVIAGDFNVKAAALAASRFPRWDAVYNNVDFILTNRTVAAVEPPLIGNYVSDAHYAIMADVAIPGF